MTGIALPPLRPARRNLLCTAFIAVLFLIALLPGAARADAGVQTTWRLLDYIAVDYPEAVADGRVVNDFEYKEMAEFSASVAERVAALPATPARAGLEAARKLRRLTCSSILPSAVAGPAGTASPMRSFRRSFESTTFVCTRNKRGES